MDKNPLKNEVFDVAVIGGGPAGMMAAGRAAERGLKVVLIDKNARIGEKLLITGGGRCNVTNAEFDTRKLLDKFKESNKYLFSAFSKWGVKETLDFFHTKKMDTKVEALQRVFPLSNKSESVWKVLVEYMKEGKVTVLSESPVLGFETEEKNGEKKITAVKVKGNKRIEAKNFILATGGLSRPETGSTGDGFKWLSELGHTIVPPDPSLVPVVIKDDEKYKWVKRVQGVVLQNIKISLFQNEVKQSSVIGRVLFTHFGISGPTVLNMSREISELLKYGEVFVTIDLLPSFAYDTLNTKLQEIFKEHNNKKFKNSLSELIPPAIVPVIVELSKIDPEKESNSVSREERLNLVKLLKNISLEVEGLLGVEKAIVTSGGVSLDEVDFKTMQSRLISNIFLIGDILNIDRPSGGYSLQLCWTTGFVAGNSTGF